MEIPTEVDSLREKLKQDNEISAADGASDSNSLVCIYFEFFTHGKIGWLVYVSNVIMYSVITYTRRTLYY